MSSSPDVVLLNARVLTMDPATPTAEALAIRAGRVAAVGSSDDVLNLRAAGTRVLDLGGRPVVPGFNDCHMHVLGLGITLLGADVSPSAGAGDRASLVAALRAWADRTPGSGWVRAYGYNQNVFPDGRHLTARDLDGAFPRRPVVVFHASGHAAVANSEALRQAGISRDTDDPAGGHIGRDDRGVPTGLVLESAISLVTRVIPPLTESERADAIFRACAQLASVGITSASDMGLGGPDIETDLAAYRRAVDQGAGVRMTLSPDVAELWRPGEIPVRDSVERDWHLEPSTSHDLPGGLRLGALKLYADGALTTRTAALKQPYVDGSGEGMLLHEPEELAGYVADAHTKGWQIATHAIGDRAIEVVLRAYESAGHENHRSTRHRIEHAMLADRSAAARMSRAQVIAVLQPEFLARLGDAYVMGLGEDRAALLNPVRLYLDTGVAVAFSSDCPVVPGAPLEGMRAAMERVTPSGRILGAAERCSFEEALAAYTRGAAMAVRDRDVGVLAPGLRADLVVLSSLPHQAGTEPPAVMATMSAGVATYGRDFLSGCSRP